MDPNTSLIYLDTVFAERVLEYSSIKEDGSLKEALSRLMMSAREGHLCLPLSSFGSKWIEEESRLASFVRFDRGHVYLEKNWAIERILEEEIRRLSVKKPTQEISTKLSLNDEQKEAVRLCLENGLTLLTGGPGTGKTFTAAAIVESLDPKGEKTVLLAAPTGRAADHLSRTIFRTCGRTFPSATLHKWLSLGRTPPWPKQEKTLKAELIIVDECSMIDAPLFATLLKAIPDGCHVVLMGDPNQLNPVGIGSIFSDLVHTEQFSYGKAQLWQSMRTENRELIALAETVLQGELPQEMLIWPTTEKAFFGMLAQFIEPMLSKGTIEKPDPSSMMGKAASCRLLNCLRQGPFGADAINAYFLERVRQETSFGHWWWAPILISQNDERTNLSNGELGIIMEKKGDRTTRIAYFPENMRELPVLELPKFEWAFCSSVHKSQGSEYEEVLVIIPPGSENFGKEMLYTAITRAKRKVSLLAADDTVRSMVAKSLVKQSGIV